MPINAMAQPQNAAPRPGPPDCLRPLVSSTPRFLSVISRKSIAAVSGFLVRVHDRNRGISGHAMTSDAAPYQQFSAPYAPDDRVIAARLLKGAGPSAAQ